PFAFSWRRASSWPWRRSWVRAPSSALKGSCVSGALLRSAGAGSGRLQLPGALELLDRELGDLRVPVAARVERHHARGERLHEEAIVRRHHHTAGEALEL